MIRDTSDQDAVIAAVPVLRQKISRWVGLALVLVIACFFLFRAFANGSKSINASRIKIAQVTRGTLVRDVAVNGRMVVAISPTLYSTASSTVTLKVKADDMVKKGDIIAEL